MKTDRSDAYLAAIAIDSTGLKRFGRDEWHQDKHKIYGKRSGQKLHIAVGDEDIIPSASLTGRCVKDGSAVDYLFINSKEKLRVSAGGAMIPPPSMRS